MLRGWDIIESNCGSPGLKSNSASHVNSTPLSFLLAVMFVLNNMFTSLLVVLTLNMSQLTSAVMEQRKKVLCILHRNNLCSLCRMWYVCKTSLTPISHFLSDGPHLSIYTDTTYFT